MGYAIWIVVILAFGWYWNKGFKPFHLAVPNTEKTPRIMINVFLALTLILTILQAFGIGRGDGFPIPK